jgi:hypothetical protein
MEKEAKKLTYEDLVKKIEKSGRKVTGGKSLIEHFGKLKRGIDGLEYQRACRSEWD